MKPKRIVPVLLVAGCVWFYQTEVQATPFSNIRIGDRDGFGFASTSGLVRATGSPHTTAADTDGDGILEQTEFLPDLNKNGSVATGSGDDFDNRSAAEKSDSVVQGSGFSTSAGTLGSKWTDISLSTSAPATGFPDPAGSGVPNEPLFNFRFDVTKGDIVEGSTLFFNLIFGDYDVVPASVIVTKNNGSGGIGSFQTISLSTQGGGADGLIQSAFLTLSFTDVFSDGGTAWNGFLDVKFQAANEPYTAFDYVELSLDQVPSTNVPDAGTTLVLFGGALAGLGALRRKMGA